jgi:hypothetical protein
MGYAAPKPTPIPSPSLEPKSGVTWSVPQAEVNANAMAVGLYNARLRVEARENNQALIYEVVIFTVAGVAWFVVKAKA